MRLSAGTLVGPLGIAFAALGAKDAATLDMKQGRTAPVRAVWSEVKWPLPLDEGSIGRAFHGSPSDCEIEINLYLRAKVSFCKCATGVSNDNDLDRAGDLELFGENFIRVAEGRHGPPRDRLAIGFNDQCDIAVATAVAATNRVTEAGRIAFDFLGADLVQRRAAAELGRDGI